MGEGGFWLNGLAWDECATCYLLQKPLRSPGSAAGSHRHCSCAEGTINNSPELGRSPTLGDYGMSIIFRVLKAHPIESA